LLKKGNKTEAIKVYRELTGVRLGEAMDAIDRAAHSQGKGGICLTFTP
jgi:ribosomal protein L7/L12